MPDRVSGIRTCGHLAGRDDFSDHDGTIGEAMHDEIRVEAVVHVAGDPTVGLDPDAEIEIAGSPSSKTSGRVTRAVGLDLPQVELVVRHARLGGSRRGLSETSQDKKYTRTKRHVGS